MVVGDLGGGAEVELDPQGTDGPVAMILMG
jgi:hypothetical protein